MQLLSDKSLNKFFGKAMLDEVLELDPDLYEAVDPMMLNEEQPEPEPEYPYDDRVSRFLHHLSSPLIHPSLMPGATHKIYETEEPTNPLKEEFGDELYRLFEEGEEAIAAPSKPEKPQKKNPGKQAPKPAGFGGAFVKPKKEKMAADPVKKAGEMAHLDEIRNNARDRMNQRIAKGKELTAQGNHYEGHGLSNPFEHMRRGFHAAFGVDPKTGQKVTTEDEPTRLKKLKDSKNLYTQFVMQHGKLSPGTAKNYKLFGQNHKTLSSAGVGYKTIGLSLTPGTHSGYEVGSDKEGKPLNYDMCPNASGECRSGCLGLTAGGNRQYPYVTMKGKLLRTHFLHEHPEAAARLMHQEIIDNEREAGKTQVQRPIKDPATGQPQMKPSLLANGKPKLDRNTGKPAQEPVTEPVFNDDGTPKFYRSGIRMNVTSDLPYEHLMPKEFFHSHLPKGNNPGTQFYDYTKMHGRFNNKNMPQNYQLALSHTGTGHDESNDSQVVKHLENGGVVASVYRRGQGEPEAKYYMDDATGKKYPVANGDEDDNVFDRHASLGVPKTQGVISGLALKGITNDFAGHFANQVDKDGVVHLNSKTGNTKGLVNIGNAQPTKQMPQQ